MNSKRYVWVVDLEGNTTTRMYRPDKLFNLREAEIMAPGRCATIHVDQGVVFVAGHARCAPRLWREATGSDEHRPNAPWAAYRGISEEKVSRIAWAWLAEKQLV